MKISKIKPRTWIGLTIVSVAGIVGVVVYSLYITVSITVPNAYAAWETAELVIQHMEANDGAWPHGWDDLHPYYKPDPSSTDAQLGFDNLIQRVEVDWKVDTTDLIQSLSSHTDDINVIWLRDGRDDRWSGADPNELIINYLKDGTRDPAPGYSNRLDKSGGPVPDLVPYADE